MGNNVLIEARDLAFSYPARPETVFSGASFRVYSGDKAALLGDNGSGKTTLLRLAAGELEPAAGSLRNRGASVFLLKQEDAAAGEASARGWLTEQGGSGGWELEAGAARLGFRAGDLERPVETFSGGERKLLALMAGFLRAPDLYLLDEPTNYLDAGAMARLAAALRAFRGAFVVVSHDRAFLDACVNKVLELKRSEFSVYAGNYSAYAAQKAAELALAAKKKEKIEGEIENLKEMERNYRLWGAAKEKEKTGAFDKGFIGARAARLQKKSARAAERAREKIGELEREKPFVEKERHVVLPEPGQAYLEVRGLSKRLAGDLAADAGEVRLNGSAKVFYMPQFRPPAMAGAKGADYFPGALLEAGCAMLDHLGADGELMFRPVASLSEGQRRKVELARFLVYGADIALLDEPTTHQDIRSVRVLEEALAGYKGILVLISHDAAFRAALPGQALRL